MEREGGLEFDRYLLLKQAQWEIVSAHASSPSGQNADLRVVGHCYAFTILPLVGEVILCCIMHQSRK